MTDMAPAVSDWTVTVTPFAGGWWVTVTRGDDLGWENWRATRRGATRWGRRAARAGTIRTA